MKKKVRVYFIRFDTNLDTWGNDFIKTHHITRIEAVYAFLPAPVHTEIIPCYELHFCRYIVTVKRGTGMDTTDINEDEGQDNNIMVPCEQIDLKKYRWIEFDVDDSYYNGDVLTDKIFEDAIEYQRR